MFFLFIAVLSEIQIERFCVKLSILKMNFLLFCHDLLFPRPPISAISHRIVSEHPYIGVIDHAEFSGDVAF